MVLRTPAVMPPKFCKNYCGSLDLFLDGLFILCLWLWLDVVFQSHLRVPGAWDSGARQQLSIYINHDHILGTCFILLEFNLSSS